MLRDRGADVVYADFDKAATLDNALRDTRALFLMGTPFGSDHATEVRQGIAAIDASARCGVSQIVYGSVAHADRDTGIPHFDSKCKVERHLAHTDLNWTVLGPAKFMDNRSAARGSPTVTMPGDESTTAPQLSRGCAYPWACDVGEGFRPVCSVC